MTTKEEKISFSRQEHIFDPEKQKTSIVVVGVGSVGSFVVLNLAKLGFNNITVIDFDKVEIHNIPNQFYRIQDVGKFKVDALKEVVKDYTDVNINIINTKIDEKYDFMDLIDLNSVVIMAVDTIEARKVIFGLLKDLPIKLLDTRMGGDIYQIYCYDLTKDEDKKRCETDLEGQVAETPCGEKSVIYTILSIASETCNIVKMIDKEENYFNVIKRDMKSLKILGKESRTVAEQVLVTSIEDEEDEEDDSDEEDDNDEYGGPY